MAKSKLGLQKEVSRIFTGIQIPKKNTAGQDARSTAPVPSVITPRTQPAPAVTSSPATPAAPVTSPAPVEVPAAVTPAVATVETPAPIPAQAPAPSKAVTPKPTAVAPKPFTIPEPPAQTVSPPTRQVVYEPPKPRQAEFDPSGPASSPVSVPVKQAKSEVVVKQPKNLPLLTIIEKVKAKLVNSKHGAASGRQKTMILMMPVLAIVLLFIAVNTLKKTSKAFIKPSNKPTAAASDNKINWEIPQPIPATLRNPLVFGSVSSQGKENTQQNPVVKGIVYSEDTPSAVIGDRIVSVGDTVGGATIVKINPDSVEFTMGDKKWTQKVEH